MTDVGELVGSIAQIAGGPAATVALLAWLGKRELGKVERGQETIVGRVEALSEKVVKFELARALVQQSLESQRQEFERVISDVKHDLQSVRKRIHEIGNSVTRLALDRRVSGEHRAVMSPGDDEP